jgi:ABC-type transporter Mla MlaB component
MAAHAPRTIRLDVTGPLAHADLPRLFERTCMLLERADAELLVCDVSEIPADAVSVDALARLALAARRRGCRVSLLGASPELRSLAAFVGLPETIIGRRAGGR